jgi:hypothetical protein
MPADLELVQLLKDLEVPECNCPRFIPCGCPGPCDCHPIPAPACPHILARRHSLTNQEWWDLYHQAYPELYNDEPKPGHFFSGPPICPDICASPGQESRVLAMSERYGPVECGDGPGLYSLWNPFDAKPEDQDMEDQEFRIAAADRTPQNERPRGMGRNGRPLLLVRKKAKDEHTRRYLQSHRPSELRK